MFDGLPDLAEAGARLGVSEMRPPADVQEPIHAGIASELVSLSPEHWDSVHLELERKPYPEGLGVTGEGVAHSIKGPDGCKEILLPTPELFVFTRQLELAFQEHGSEWRKVEYRVWYESGEWRWEVHFQYDRHGVRTKV